MIELYYSFKTKPQQMPELEVVKEFVPIAKEKKSSDAQDQVFSKLTKCSSALRLRSMS